MWFVFPVSAQVFCFNEDAKDIEKGILEHNEEFVMSGITTAGTPIIFITPDGRICTGVNFTGTVIEKLKLNNGKGT